MQTEYRTISFHPAVGWRAVYLGDTPGETHVIPVAGWLVREEVVYDQADQIDRQRTPAADDRERLVVAGIASDATVEPADLADNFWLLLAPGEQPPTPTEAETEQRDRASKRADR
ncbi:hypothetical protein FH609_011620 [Streptomyces sp. 3MP-14]|uniref:Uncharacterized protein n=1 Tax=Streptomyces mimosae TaxID=2586635 RepID=A0A5N6AFM6_9ACTN|nr:MULTISPECIES: hypothetical protein [Streptomyces]KAB8167045.1 hypothetical protein FH607_009070 [Streptomyces mimosae]KAB8176986.1 hypothetical protein FH609_011620 [Streptomyces sp. 3MP-14]